MFPLVMLVVNVSSVAVIWFGGHRVDNGQMEVGALTAFLSYLMQILMSVMMATFMLMMVPRASVCGDRIAEVLDTHTSVPTPDEPVAARPGLRGWLDLERRDVRLPRAPRSRCSADVSFSARPGQTVAVIGSTGAGKSTLVNLVPRLFDATSGAVRVGGSDVRRLDPDLLWAQIGLVPQKAYLFSGTVRSNLLHGKPDATEDELWAALEVAQARDFVEALPDGLDAPVSQGGTNFSGGQRQRLAIARALVRRPGIYLFDDSFSALDLATDARLRAALRPSTTDATMVIVAQRVSTISDADLILVLEDGRVVGRGTHQELLDGLRDVPGDRHLPADRGGGGMSEQTASTVQDKQAASRPPSGSRRRRAAPARGPMGGGMVGQKAMTFVPSGEAAGRRMRPDRVKAIAVVCSASSASS